MNDRIKKMVEMFKKDKEDKNKIVTGAQLGNGMHALTEADEMAQDEMDQSNDEQDMEEEDEMEEDQQAPKLFGHKPGMLQIIISMAKGKKDSGDQ